jgi:uncharacterized protein
VTSAWRIEVIPRIQDVAPAYWDSCAGSEDPFVCHEFLSILEASGSASTGTGWSPHHFVARRTDGSIGGVMPAYLKSHSQGEYIFDHGWADAYERAGGNYYPKLQIAVPFSPVPGPRLLLADPDAAPALLQGAEQLCGQLGLSSAHATFVSPSQCSHFNDAGWLIRQGQQFHWINRDYDSFDGFLDALSSRKRKMIRKERETARASGLDIRILSGSDIQESHWDSFWHFYQDTGARKWGQPYLTRRFFSLLGERLAHRLLLVLALRGQTPIAGALNLIGENTLFGRYWGCMEDHPCLHFELCYYQAIDFAIGAKLAQVQAGAQGPHKLARGYEPVSTWSAHHIVHPGFRSAVADFLRRETQQVEAEINYLGRFTPFRHVEEQD